MALAAAMTRAADSGNSINAKFFSSIDEQKLNELLKGDEGVEIPLLKERLYCLQGKSILKAEACFFSPVIFTKNLFKLCKHLLKTWM